MLACQQLHTVGMDLQVVPIYSVLFVASDGSTEVMRCVSFSKDSGKTASPSGCWEAQVFALNRDYRVCAVTWLTLWLVTKHEAPGWKVWLLLAALSPVSNSSSILATSIQSIQLDCACLVVNVYIGL